MIITPIGSKETSHRYRRKIREGVYYIVRHDNSHYDNHEAWHVNIDGGEFHGLTGKYRHILLRDHGKTIDYQFQVKWLPTHLEDRDKLGQVRFDELMRDILIDWLRYAHQHGMMKYAEQTEEMKAKGQYAVIDDTNEISLLDKDNPTDLRWADGRMVHGDDENGDLWVKDL